MVLSTAEAGRASPVWALNQILIEVLEEGIDAGQIVPLRKRNGEAELMRQLTLMFGHAIESLRMGTGLTLTGLARSLRLPNPGRVLGLLATVQDWNWLLDHIRFAASNQGVLGVAGSAMVLKSAPCVRRGASIFGVASRSLPQPVMKRLEQLRLAPSYNYPSHSMATDCSAWLVEVGEDWSFPLRLEPLPQRTWFDPASYAEELRLPVTEALEAVHGHYETDNGTIVRERVIESVLASVRELYGDPAGMVFESGCLQHGLKGKETGFIGGDLAQIVAIEAQGAGTFFDLTRRPPADPRGRGQVPFSPWSGRVSIGGRDCSFLVEVEGCEKELNSDQMAWAAQMAIRSEDRPEQLRGVFRPASGIAMRDVCEDPRRVRYVVAQALVGKLGSSRSARREVGFLVRDYRGEVSSGWSILSGDMHAPNVQGKAIARAEAHLRRVGPGGEFERTVEHLRAVGVQDNPTRNLPQIRARHGLAMAADILHTRASLYV